MTSQKGIMTSNFLKIWHNDIIWFLRHVARNLGNQLYSRCLQSMAGHLAGPFELVVQMALASMLDPDGDVKNFPRPQDPGICSGAN